MSTLHELSSEIAALVREIDEAGGELPADVESRLDRLGGDLTTKVYRLDCWRRNMESDLSEVGREMERLGKLSNTLHRRLNWLEMYIKRGMDAAGVRKVAGATWGVSICTNGMASVKVAPEVVVEELPARFRREVHEVNLDVKAVREAAARGEELPPGISMQRGEHMRWK